MKREKKVRRRRRSSKKIQSRIQSSFSASFLPNWIFSAQICFNWLYQWRPEERDKLFSLSTSYPEFWQQASCLPSSLSCQSERHSNNELIIQEREKWCHTLLRDKGCHVKLVLFQSCFLRLLWTSFRDQWFLEEGSGVEVEGIQPSSLTSLVLAFSYSSLHGFTVKYSITNTKSILTTSWDLSSWCKLAQY